MTRGVLSYFWSRSFLWPRQTEVTKSNNVSKLSLPYPHNPYYGIFTQHGVWLEGSLALVSDACGPALCLLSLRLDLRPCTSDTRVSVSIGAHCVRLCSKCVPWPGQNLTRTPLCGVNSG